MRKIFLLFAFLCLTHIVMADSVTYRIQEYNTDAGDFTLSACGMRPEGSYALFENDFGATSGNRYNQIPKNKQATLWLMGWEGCTITRVTLWMCSNNKSGQMALIVKAGDRELYTMHTQDFASDEWFGTWVSKDLCHYVELSRHMTTLTPVSQDEDVAITIKGGLSDGSVYVNAITIDYTHDEAIATESPLGYVYEKLEKKSTLNDGDVVMMYRSGDAAGDIDGMEESHYLDAIGLASTSKVTEPFVETFTLSRTADGHWTMTNAYDQQLGASGAKNLTWDEGVTTWDITLGYDGATIASTNTKYGTMRYNAPVDGYPRFWNYTSTSLSLPYLYRRVRAVEPVTCTQLTLQAPGREVKLGEQDTLVIGYSIAPVTATDTRVAWTSSNEAVAVVKSGIVFPQSAGTTVITASTFDGGATAEYSLTVMLAETAIKDIKTENTDPIYDLTGRKLQQPHRGELYLKGGKKHISR